MADAVKLVRAGASPGVVKDFGYGYDVNGQLTSIKDNTAGALTDTYEVRYDGLLRADQVRELKAGAARSTTTYGYDANSNLASWFADDQVAPETDQFTAYSYDVRDMLESVKAGSSPSDTSVETTTYTYTSRGERATETKPNGNKVTYRYIEDGSLRSQVENRIVGDSPTLVSSHAYGYNLDGHRASDVSKVANADTAGAYLAQTASLVYTADNRLRWITKSGANAGGFEGYAYDAAGSVSYQRRGTTDIWYKLDRNRLLCAGASSTDPCGVAGSASYNYDPFGRLDTVTTGDAAGDKVVERYGDDGFDRAISHRKFDPATGGLKSSRSSVFDPLDRTVQETTQAGTSPARTTTFGYLGLSDRVVSEEQPDPGAGGAAKTTASYTYGPSGERLSQTKTPLSGGAGGVETSFYGTNAHTDVETLTSESGTVRSTYRYSGYGENDAAGFTGKDKASATGGPEVEAYNPYRFNSKRWDPATGSYDMGFRDYSPGLNRFLTRDMYNGALADLRLGSDPWTGNRYAFAGGNPITGIEYDGHCPMAEEGGCTEGTGATQPKATSTTQSGGRTVTDSVTRGINRTLGLPDGASEQQRAIRTSQLGLTSGWVGLITFADEADRLGVGKGVELLGELSGSTDAMMCISEFEKMACAWTAASLTPLRIGKAGRLPAATAAARATKAATRSKPFAMGISDHLDDFARMHGADTWKHLDDPTNWKSGVLQKLRDPNQRVLFNLDDVDVWPGVTRAASGRGGATDWELLQIRNGDFTNLEFWKNGQRVESPFQ